jgi:hypothetical protein
MMTLVEPDPGHPGALQERRWMLETREIGPTITVSSLLSTRNNIQTRFLPFLQRLRQDERKGNVVRSRRKDSNKRYRDMMTDSPEKLAQWKENNKLYMRQYRANRKNAAPPADPLGPDPALHSLEHAGPSAVDPTALHLPEHAGPSVPLTQPDIDKERLWLVVESAHSQQHEG